MPADNSWWVFDRPLHRDWLFIAGLVVSLLGMIWIVVRSDEVGAAAFVVSIAMAAPSGVLATGLIGGTVREYLRGRRGILR